jgi:hypothetical protein
MSATANANENTQSNAMAPPPSRQPAAPRDGNSGGNRGRRPPQQQQQNRRRPQAQHDQLGRNVVESSENRRPLHQRNHGGDVARPQGGPSGRRRPDGDNHAHQPPSRHAKFLRHTAKDRKDHGGVQMTGQINECLICCQRSDLFGIGSCLHPACMECSIRMRISGESNICPQCRSPNETLYFVSAPKSWDNFRLPKQRVPHADEQKYHIRFESDYAVRCYESYMAHNCHVCTKRGDEHSSFPTFAALRQHMGQVHQLSFCHICCENLNILTKDRKTYTKPELQRHMKEGDKGDDGIRGHPTCLFCEQRFFDEEQQYRHLRKDHYFCQICDTDGADNYFYAKPEQLYRHYQKEHYTCLDRECLEMGIVFRSEMELNVHKAKNHATGIRSIPVDFQFSNRVPGGQRAGPSRGRMDDNTSGSASLLPAASGYGRVALVPNPQPNGPSRPDNVVIVPSAQSTNPQPRIIRSAYNPAGNEFPSLAPSRPYGAPPDWRVCCHFCIFVSITHFRRKCSK